MKSARDVLLLASKIRKAITKSLPPGERFDIALVGGMAVIAHGVERTTSDMDFCFFTESISKNTNEFLSLLKEAIPSNFSVDFVEGSKIADDPFKHDIVFLRDNNKEFPRIDFIVAKYKWELEGIQKASALDDIKFPVLPKPYLIAMKLRAGGYQDLSDASKLYDLLSASEREETERIAKLVHRDRKLKEVLMKKRSANEDEDPSQLISGPTS